MEKKTVIEKVKSLLEFETEEVAEVVEPTEEQNFLNAKTKDGLEIKVEGNSFVEGAIVMVISEEGEAVSGAADYELEDGTIVKVGEDGAVVSVEEVVEEETTEEVEASTEELEASTEEVVEEVNPLEARVEGLESKLDEIISKFNSVVEEVNKFSATPNDEEVNFSKVELIKQKKADVLDDIAAFRKRLNK